MSANPAPETPDLTSAPPNPDTTRKRARPTKSCFECRRKKLKCDRVQPCMQCKKLGREALCAYAYGPPGHSDFGNENAERSPKRPKIDVSRLNSWGGEAARNLNVPTGSYVATALPMDYQKTTMQESSNRTDGSQLKTSGRLQVEGSKSRYIGLGDRMTLLDHFKDEKDFITKSFTDPIMAPIVNEMTVYQRALHRKVQPVNRSFEDRTAVVAEMLNSLPENTNVEALKERYLANMETVLRVVHVPTFKRHCSEIQNSRTAHNPTLPSTVPESVLAQLLAVISIVSRLSDSSDMKASEQALSEERVATCLALIPKWLDCLKGRERLTIDTLRVETLLLMARFANMVTLPDLWKESGALVRAAMAMGLHRDPEHSSDLSPFAKEQRRKLWQTIVELDLQFSLATGMPCAVQSSDIGSRTLLRVNDDELVEDMPNYPVERPIDTWSDALPQNLLASALKPRLDATNMLARDIDFNADVDRILFLAKYLELGMRSIQARLPQQPKTKQRLLSDIMLDVYLRRPAIALYQTVALSDQASRHPEARKGVLRNSVAILTHLDALDPAVADLDTIQSKDYLNFFHLLFRDDIIKSSILLCYEIRAFHLPIITLPPVDPALLDSSSEDSIPWTKHSLTRIVENTLNSYLQRLGEFGTDLKIILPLSIVLQSVRFDGTPEGKRDLMIRGAERVLQACRKAIPLPPTPDVQTQNGTAPNTQIPASNIPTGESWNPPQGFAMLPYENGVPQPVDNSNFNSNVNGACAFPNFELGFSDWDLMDQSWFGSY
ncbi:Fusarisetin A cluster transcription factor [Lachnellula occidentalis]|uniref:Fusarisetin A cluster transcription factor n=1 Tax=Lachnellula occidentalis TaxID=215460 RepID=A0A8H8RZ43_9HELO|nr:Fusarisetin A cluster transcription factor [Lachnellula occidentalis]